MKIFTTRVRQRLYLSILIASQIRNVRGCPYRRTSISVDTDLHAHCDRKLMTTYGGGPLQSSAPSETSVSVRKPFHILSTSSMGQNEVLVHFSDGSAAVFEAEELEKLRPKPKRILSGSSLTHNTPIVIEPAVPPVPAGDLNSPVLDRAVA